MVALLSPYFFIIAVLAGSSYDHSVMYSGINSVPPLDPVTPVGAQPYASPQDAIYFIVYMIIMTFILLQLFIGVVIVAFQEVGDKSYRETKLDRNQVRITVDWVLNFFLRLALTLKNEFPQEIRIISEVLLPKISPFTVV